MEVHNFLSLSETGGKAGGFFGKLPTVRSHSLREPFFLGLFPNDFDRTAKQIHQSVFESIAGNGGNQESDDDACNHDPQVLKVLKERFFILFLIGLVA